MLVYTYIVYYVHFTGVHSDIKSLFLCSYRRPTNLRRPPLTVDCCYSFSANVLCCRRRQNRIIWFNNNNNNNILITRFERANWRAAGKNWCEHGGTVDPRRHRHLSVDGRSNQPYRHHLLCESRWRYNNTIIILKSARVYGLCFTTNALDVFRCRDRRRRRGRAESRTRVYPYPPSSSNIFTDLPLPCVIRHKCLGLCALPEHVISQLYTDKPLLYSRQVDRYCTAISTAADEPSSLSSYPSPKTDNAHTTFDDKQL